MPETKKMPAVKKGGFYKIKRRVCGLFIKTGIRGHVKIAY